MLLMISLQLLLSRDVGKRSSKRHAEEDANILDALKVESPDAAVMFLEHLILERRSTVSSLVLGPTRS
jgi:DNA-binding GntR family transcriptional regulator